ncbi:MAG: hypothetical protein JWN46_900 [Acidimicrobiales bacterium]|nr:hypothetical protein [Acidimicrobiales bacterium]
MAYLAVDALVIGVWATVAPRSFFDSFPGRGHHWVAVEGPYNEHLAGDVGALFLALAIVTVAALVSRSQSLTRAAAAAWVISGIPHLIHHIGHRRALPTIDQVVSLGGLASFVLVGLACTALAPSDVTPATNATSVG